MTTRAAVVGGGIIGTAVARELTRRLPGVEVTLVEKEERLAAHQTGHNSGVVHAGLYYEPGSLKARLCRRGVHLLQEFAGRHGIAYDECGKVVVARDERESARLDALHARAVANGVPDVRLVDADGLRQVEPHAVGLRALHSPRTAIVDYPAVTAALASELAAAGATVLLGHEVVALAVPRGARSPCPRLPGSTTTFDLVVTCAGLQSDRLARSAGDDPEPRIVPFFGDYVLLAEDQRDLVRGLVYPVPDPRYPFLGVHLTRRVDGEVMIGPNAFLSPGRESYDRPRPVLRDLRDALGFGGFWRFAASNLPAAVREARTASSRHPVRRRGPLLRARGRPRARPSRHPRHPRAGDGRARPAGRRLRDHRLRADRARAQRAVPRRHLLARDRRARRRRGPAPQWPEPPQRKAAPVTPSALAPGLWGVLATPFHGPTLQVDTGSLRREVEHYLEVPADGLVVLGVFGEGASLTAEERHQVVATVARTAPRTPLVVGVSARSTAVAVEQARQAVDAAGTDPRPTWQPTRTDPATDPARPVSVMVLVNSAEPVALAAHLAAVHEATGAGIVLQDYPETSGVRIDAGAILEVLDRCPFVVAVKSEAPPTSVAIGRLTSSTTVPVFGGLGGVGLLDELASGAAGAMTGFSHPAGLRAALDAWRDGGAAAAREAFMPWLPLVNYEAQPGIGLAVRKEILQRRGLFEDGAVRPPARPAPPEILRLLPDHLAAV